MQIRDLEQRTNLERPTIRYYEQEGLITPVRQENGYRDYSQEDLNTLLKIKLLRQLGMSLEMIRDLQQGREDFASALAEQIRLLERQMAAIDKARSVCSQMLDDGVRYDNLDAEYYLDLLSKPAKLESGFAAKPVLEFQSSIMREYHPIRRFLARMIDYSLIQLVLIFFAFVILRLRYSYLSYMLISAVIGIAAGLAAIPINGFLIHKLGTTPGKWLLGLSVRSCNGNLLELKSAMKREFGVWKYGLGFGIPIWSIICMAASHRQYKKSGTPDWDFDWDYDAEMEYAVMRAKKNIASAGCILVLIVCSILLTFEIILPKYQNGNITIRQFSTNYNYFWGVLEQSPNFIGMDEEGRWELDDHDVFTIYHDGRPSDFKYEVENGIVQKITYDHTRYRGYGGKTIDEYSWNAAIIAVLSQKGNNFWDAVAFVKEFTEAIKPASGRFTYKNLEFVWNSKTSDYELVDGYYHPVVENLYYPRESRIEYQFEIIFHDA